MSRGLPTFAEKVADISTVNPSCSQGQPLSNSKAIEKKVIKKVGKKEYHLWQKRDSARSGQKALNLVRIVSGLPNEKEAVYGALDKWTAWETEFPLIAKALRMLRKRSRWIRVIQGFGSVVEREEFPEDFDKFLRTELNWSQLEDAISETHVAGWVFWCREDDRPPCAPLVSDCGEATMDLNLLPPLAVLRREHTIAAQRSCQAVHISGRQKVTARL